MTRKKQFNTCYSPEFKIIARHGDVVEIDVRAFA